MLDCHSEVIPFHDQVIPLHLHADHWSMKMTRMSHQVADRAPFGLNFLAIQLLKHSPSNYMLKAKTSVVQHLAFGALSNDANASNVLD
jgi:hypothetical protein